MGRCGVGRLAGAFGLAVVMAGCAAKPSADVMHAAKTGEMSFARVRLQSKVSAAPDAPRPSDQELASIEQSRQNNEKLVVNSKDVDRDYLLDRARLLGLMLGDGYNGHAEPVANDLARLLRTQGLNANRRVAAVLLNEDVKIWKGEPFEQAMALCWVGTHYGIQGDWENVRAASGNALFQLQDFGTTTDPDTGEAVPYTTETLGTAMANEQVLDDTEGDNGYQLVDSNFVLGYLLNAIANQQMGRQAEADDNYRKALKYNAALGPVVTQLKLGRYNTLLVVEYGLGPQKQGYGMDNAFARFVPMTGADQSLLVVEGAASRATAPPAMDLNAIAASLMWNNLEDVRIAKSYLGTALVAGGAVVASGGLGGDDPAQALVGLGIMLAGAYVKAQAHVDTRYNEAVPQRVYIVPAMISGPKDKLTLQIEGKPGSRMVIGGIDPPSDGSARMHYVRMPSAYLQAPQWAVNGTPLYANEHAPNAGTAALPYIMGGHCVRPPTEAALARYQAAGYLQGYTLQGLIDLYRAEGIAWEYAWGELPGLHVLDGGDSLAAPEAGTTGYHRLMCEPHPPYPPKSELLRNAIAGLTPVEPAAAP